jgi:tryptophan-rich sensory protein
MMAVAAWMVWRKNSASGRSIALKLFVVQLIFNGLWSWLFFGLQRPDLALVDIILLWMAIFATIVAFRRVRRTAAWLLIPYAAWVTFAAALNTAIWYLNT